jgi:hypothetical protein
MKTNSPAKNGRALQLKDNSMHLSSITWLLSQCEVRWPMLWGGYAFII